MSTLKDKILNSDDLGSNQKLFVPEWDVTVNLRSLTRSEMLGVNKADDPDMYVLLKAVVDDDNKPVFTQADVAALNKKSPWPIKKILDVILAANAVKGVDDEKKD